MSSYIAHPRKTSNALNASVRCEQKRLQRLSETVPANTVSGSRKLSGREFQTDGPATERLHLRAFAKFTANDLPYDRTDLELTWLS